MNGEHEDCILASMSVCKGDDNDEGQTESLHCQSFVQFIVTHTQIKHQFMAIIQGSKRGGLSSSSNEWARLYNCTGNLCQGVNWHTYRSMQGLAKSGHSTNVWTLSLVKNTVRSGCRSFVSTGESGANEPVQSNQAESKRNGRLLLIKYSLTVRCHPDPSFQVNLVPVKYPQDNVSTANYWSESLSLCFVDNDLFEGVHVGAIAMHCTEDWQSKQCPARVNHWLAPESMQYSYDCPLK